MIEVRGLGKTYRTHRKAPGLWGSVRGLFRREHVEKHAVVDVSFISLRLVLPAVAAVLDHSGAPIVALVKPQFEAGRENVGKGGVVRGEVRQRAIDSVLRWLTDRGFEVRDTIDSPVAGPNGNVEALAYLGAP